jgi:hypothetical protein
MTEHDRIRRDRALAHQATTFHSIEDELDSLQDAIRGLQSTDDPSLCPLHDELMARWQTLTGKHAQAETPS